MHKTTLRSRAFAALTTTLTVALVSAGMAGAPRVAASPGPALRIVDAAGNTPVVNEGGRIALRVVDGSGSPVSVSSWSSDNRMVGKVKRTNGLLRGKSFGFATVTAQTSQGPVSGFVVCARLRRQNGAMTQGDTKTDTGGNVYLSHPVRHVLYKTTAVSADVFAGATGESGYQEGTGDGVRFNGPAGIGIDNRAEGGLYVADSANHCIRKIDFRRRSSLAAGTPGFDGTMFGDETPISEAVFTNPRGVASVGANLYVTDTGNHCVWYVDVQRQRVQLVAGEPGNAGNTNGQGRTARFDNPSGITINTRGNLLAVADTGNNVVRLIAIAPRAGSEGGVIGQVTTLGLGSSARDARILEKLDSDRGTDEITFDQPISVSFDGVDNVYVIDNQTASVVTRPSAASGRPVERVDLAQVGTLGDPASVTVRRTQAFVLDEAATSDASAVNVVEVGAPTIASVTPEIARLEGGTQVTVTGTNFAPESKLTLGDAEVTTYTVETSTRITLTVPAQQAPGLRTLTVFTRGGVAQAKVNILAKALDEISPGEITTIAGGVADLGEGGYASAAAVRDPQAVAFDSAGNVLFCTQTRVQKVDIQTGVLTTVAGNGNLGYSGDGGLATAAELDYAISVGVDQTNNIYIGESTRIRRVDGITGIITTFVGNASAARFEDQKNAGVSPFVHPGRFAFDPAGNLFVADFGKILRIDAVTQAITIVAGSGGTSWTGDDSLATEAGLRPTAIAFDRDGNLFVCDKFEYNTKIRRIDRETGIITTVAGAGTGGTEHNADGDGGAATDAHFGNVYDVAIDAAGNLYVDDFDNGRIRRIGRDDGLVYTVAGVGSTRPPGEYGESAVRVYPRAIAVRGDGTLVAANYGYPGSILGFAPETGRSSVVAGGPPQTINDGEPAAGAPLLDLLSVVYAGQESLYVANRFAIYRLDGSSKRLFRVAGGAYAGFDGDGGPARDAVLWGARNLRVAAAGDLYFFDINNFRVRRVRADVGTIDTVAGNGLTGESPDGSIARESSIGISGVALDAADNVYVSEFIAGKIRRVDATSGLLGTFAGNGVGGDGSPAISARLLGPVAQAFGPDGSLFFVDDTTRLIRRIDGATGRISTLAGRGVPTSGNGDGGPALQASVDALSICVDSAGNVYVGEIDRIRRIDAQTGTISTIVGDGSRQYRGDGGPAERSSVYFVSDMSFDPEGNLYFTDASHGAVRVVKNVGAPKR